METQPRVTYGGQAVIEGVMIRGRRFYSLAVRQPNGRIYHYHERLNSAFTGRVRQIPLLRGILILVETLMLGIKALNRSAALASAEESDDNQGEIPGWLLALTLVVSLTLGVSIFFILPLLAARLADPLITSDIVSNLIEGAIRLVILVAYIGGIGMMKDIRRVFAYHGAEHMAVHTYEAGLDLTVEKRPQVRYPPSPLRHRLPAHRGPGFRGGFCLSWPAGTALANTFPTPADSGSRRHQLRSYPLCRPAPHLGRLQAGFGARFVAAAADHPPTGG